MTEEAKSYTRSQIYEARMAWIKFLMTKGRKKAVERLDVGGGARCCLGHACYILGIKGRPILNIPGDVVYGFTYEGNEKAVPQSLVEKLGLWADLGESGDGAFLGEFLTQTGNQCNSLALINDETDATPYQIGKYLLTVIEGGTNTPFRLLTDYRE